MSISETTARNLSLDELAARLREHVDPAVRVFAERVDAALTYAELQEEGVG